MTTVSSDISAPECVYCWLPSDAVTRTSGKLTNDLGRLVRKQPMLQAEEKDAIYCLMREALFKQGIELFYVI